MPKDVLRVLGIKTERARANGGADDFMAFGRFQGLGFRVQGLGFRVQVQGLGFRV